MLSNIRRMFLVPGIAVAICGWLVSSALAANKFTGAIHTTNFRGTAVNQNHFHLKEEVFLNGGPQHTKGPLLPPGRYYFQVTDTSGQMLLSTDNAFCRQVVVGALGKISGRPGESLCEHLLGSDNYPGDPRPNDTPVQLVPFDSSKSGVYKVWLIAQSSAISGCNTTPAGDGIRLNFANGCAKTDNFKVDFQVQPACAGWEDNFSGTELDLIRWFKESGPAPGSVPDQNNLGTFDPNNVSVGGGLLRLTMTQVPDGTGWRSTGALIRTQVPCGYGTYEWTMRMGSTANDPIATGVNLSGGVSAGLTYWNNSEHEIVFEHSAHTATPPSLSPESIWFVNFHNTDPQNGNHDPEAAGEGTTTEHGLLPIGNVYNQFHRYRFVWEPGTPYGRISFYIDDDPNPKAVHTGPNVPTVPGLFLVSYFGRNFPFWGGFATPGTRYFYVDRVSFTPLP